MHRYLFACEGVLDNKIARDEMWLDIGIKEWKIFSVDRNAGDEDLQKIIDFPCWQQVHQ